MKTSKWSVELTFKLNKIDLKKIMTVGWQWYNVKRRTTRINEYNGPVTIIKGGGVKKMYNFLSMITPDRIQDLMFIQIVK